MIYLKRNNLNRCLGLSEAMDTAIQYIQTADLSKLTDGRNDVDGDSVFINRFDYHTIPKEQAEWEGHIQYADIHVLLSGQEFIGIANAESLKQISDQPDDDFRGYEGPVTTWIPMTTEDILIVYPEDVHMVSVINGESTLVQKACFKVKV